LHSPFVTLDIEVWIAPFIYRLIQNTFYLTLDNEDGEAEYCFHMSRGYEINTVAADVYYGYNHCLSSFYDALVVDGSFNSLLEPECEIVEHEIGTVYSRTFGKFEYKQFGPDTCEDREIDLDEPEQIMDEMLDDTVVDEYDDEYADELDGEEIEDMIDDE